MGGRASGGGAVEQRVTISALHAGWILIEARRIKLLTIRLPPLRSLPLSLVRSLSLYHPRDYPLCALPSLPLSLSLYIYIYIYIYILPISIYTVYSLHTAQSAFVLAARFRFACARLGPSAIFFSRSLSLFSSSPFYTDDFHQFS